MKSYTATYKLPGIVFFESIEYTFESENIEAAKWEANRYKHANEIHGRMKVRRTR